MAAKKFSRVFFLPLQIKQYAIGVVSSFILSASAYADRGGLGEWSRDIVNGPFTGLGYTLNAISFMVGVGFILGAYMQYQAHRDNPSQVRVSTPIFLLCAGILLIILPLLSWVAQGGAFLRPAK